MGLKKVQTDQYKKLRKREQVKYFMSTHDKESIYNIVFYACCVKDPHSDRASLSSKSPKYKSLSRIWLRRLFAHQIADSLVISKANVQQWHIGFLQEFTSVALVV